MGTAGEAAAAAAAAAPPLVEGPATAEELVESPISSLSLASLSLTTFSPLMMLHRMANMDSDILPPYTLRGFLFHKLITALKAAWKKIIPYQTSRECNSQGYLVSNYVYMSICWILMTKSSKNTSNTFKNFMLQNTERTLERSLEEKKTF